MLGSVLDLVGSLLGVGSPGSGPQGAPAPDIGAGLVGGGAIFAALLIASFIRWRRQSNS
jgi:hypothetical protein